MPACELDYPHKPVWCDACYGDARQTRMERIQRETLAALKRRNDLLEEELDLEFSGRRRPRREASPPPAPEKRSPSGGVDVRPRSINTD